MNPNASLWWRSSLVAIATGVSDYIWARYISTVANADSIVAANWSFLTIALGALVVVSYVDDRRLIIPAAIGAWIGTYLAV